jgi:hypothetical protein
VGVGDRFDQFKAIAVQASRDLFDQDKPFGRLALVQVLMLAGDTLVTISLAGSLFFSISPTGAKSRVFLYLVLTIAPFAVVSPLLGPLIDRTRGARRAMVVFSAVGRAAMCPLMARDTHSLLLFPEAFCILVLSKLYLVTRGALVPEMAAATAAGADDLEPPARLGDFFGGKSPEPARPSPPAAAAETPGAKAEAEAVSPVEYAALNARLTLLGTVAGFIASVPAIILLKTLGSPSILIFGAFVFAGAAVAGVRLPVSRHRLIAVAARPLPWGHPGPRSAEERLQPIAQPEVMLGLSTMALIRGLAGFLVMMLAFGLRRLQAPLSWYGLALGLSGIGALVGLVFVPRLRRVLSEQRMILAAIWLIALGAVGAAWWNTLFAQVVLAFVVGLAGSLAQPSFDALTQRLVPVEAQGRAFARFAMRQQMVWVVGAIFPVVFAIALQLGDVIMAVVGAAGGLFYVAGRRALRTRALPRRRTEGGG